MISMIACDYEAENVHRVSETRCSSNKQAGQEVEPEGRYARWQIPGCTLTHAQSTQRSAQELGKPDGNRGGVSRCARGADTQTIAMAPKANGIIRQAGRKRKLQNGRSSNKRANHLARWFQRQRSSYLCQINVSLGITTVSGPVRT